MQPQPERQVEEMGTPRVETNGSFLPFPEETLSRSWPGCLGRTGAVCCMPSLCPTTPSRTRVSPSPESDPCHHTDPCPSPEPNPGLNRGSPTCCQPPCPHRHAQPQACASREPLSDYACCPQATPWAHSSLYSTGFFSLSQQLLCFPTGLTKLCLAKTAISPRGTCSEPPGQ